MAGHRFFSIRAPGLRRALLGNLLCIVMVGCGGSSPAAPSEAAASGTWKGTVTNSLAGTGAAALAISQSGSVLSGTWNLAGPDGPADGSVTGAATGPLIALTLLPNKAGQCPYTVNATVTKDRMTGIYASFNCTIVSSGSIDLTRQ